jgi:hypothetical protein
VVESPSETEDSGSEEGKEREDRYYTSVCMRKDNSGLEDKLGYYLDAPIPSDSDTQEEARWWSPGPQELSSEEDEEEIRYLTNLLGMTVERNDSKDGVPPSQGEDAFGSSSSNHRAAVEGQTARGREPPSTSGSAEAEEKGGDG